MKKYLFVFILIPALLIITFSACTTPELQSEITKTIEPDKTIDISDINPLPTDSEVKVGDIIWKIVSVEDLGTSLKFPSGDVYIAERGKFISVRFTVSNTGDEDKILYDLDVIDNKGRAYSLCLPAYGYFTSSEACAFVEVLQQTEYTFVAPFDLAPDAEGLVLEVTDLNPVPIEKEYIDLGV